ncbi:MAG: transposase [Limisphaerales bacterium]
MHTTSNPQLGLLDSFMPLAPANDFLATLDRALDWRPVGQALQAMYPARTGRPPCAPLVLFKMSLLQHCCGLSDPQCEELVGDRLSWRRFVRLGLQGAVPDEATPVNFRRRLRQYGQHETLLGLVNRQLEQQGLTLKTCTLVDAPLLQATRDVAARRCPVLGEKSRPRTSRDMHCNLIYPSSTGRQPDMGRLRDKAPFQFNSRSSEGSQVVVFIAEYTRFRPILATDLFKPWGRDGIVFRP